MQSYSFEQELKITLLNFKYLAVLLKSFSSADTVDGEVSKIQSFGTGGSFVAAIKGDLYFFAMTGSSWYKLGGKLDAHQDIQITLLLALSADILVTGADDSGEKLTVWDISQVKSTPFAVTEAKSTSYGGKIKGGCMAGGNFFYAVGDTVNKVVKYDIALNTLGASNKYEPQINAAAIHGSLVVVGLEDGTVASFANN